MNLVQRRKKNEKRKITITTSIDSVKLDKDKIQKMIKSPLLLFLFFSINKSKDKSKKPRGKQKNINNVKEERETKK